MLEGEVDYVSCDIVRGWGGSDKGKDMEAALEAGMEKTLERHVEVAEDG